MHHNTKSIHRPAPISKTWNMSRGVWENQVWNGLHLPRSSLEQKHTVSQQQERSGWVERRMEGGERNEVAVRTVAGLTGVSLIYKKRGSFCPWHVQVDWLHVLDVAWLWERWMKKGKGQDEGKMRGKANTWCLGFNFFAVYDAQSVLAHIPSFIIFF